MCSPDLRERHPERPLPGLELWSLLGSGVGGELLPKSEVLKDQGATRCEDRAEAPDQKAHEKAHSAGTLHQPACSRFPTRMGFSRITVCNQ